jgi:hypothetical protein
MYNPYLYPQPTYVPPQLQMQPQPQPQQASADIVWVQGRAGAKAYFVPAGHTAQLMDSEEEVFYLKTVDASGIPAPLRTFAYQEITEAQALPAAPEEYATKAELEELRNMIKEAKIDESVVSTARKASSRQPAAE